MLEELKLAREIAVDVEHHDEHSYIGLVSLMQISTRDKDWLVDTLKPWRENVQVLNEVFTDPNILKVGLKDSPDGLSLTPAGFPRVVDGHDLATKRLRFVRGWLIRHVSCVPIVGIPKTRAGVSAKTICQFRRCKTVPNGGLANTVRIYLIDRTSTILN